MNILPMPHRKQAAFLKAISLVVEQSAIRRYNLDSNSPEIAFEETRKSDLREAPRKSH